MILFIISYKVYVEFSIDICIAFVNFNICSNLYIFIRIKCNYKFEACAQIKVSYFN